MGTTLDQLSARELVAAYRRFQQPLLALRVVGRREGLLEASPAGSA